MVLQPQPIALLINDGLLLNANAMHQIHISFCGADITSIVQLCVRISKARRTTDGNTNINAKTVKRTRHILDSSERA